MVGEYRFTDLFFLEAALETHQTYKTLYLLDIQPLITAALIFRWKTSGRGTEIYVSATTLKALDVSNFERP